MIEQDDDLLRDDEPLAEEHVSEGDEPDDAQDDADDGDDDAQDQQPRDEQGRFAPVAALQSLRKEKQELQRRLEALERDRQPQQPTQQRDLSPEERQRSDFLDKDEFEALQDLTWQFVDEDMKPSDAKLFMDSAKKWFTEELGRADPVLAQAIVSAPSPYRELVRRYEQALILELVQQSGIDLSDPDGWAQQRVAQHQPRGNPQQSTPSRAPPPRSIASVPSSGGGAGSVATGPGVAFDDVFK